MKIPKKLKIGAHVYDVSFEDIEEDAYHDSLKLKIVINKHIKKSASESALIHEIFHAINSQTRQDILMHSLIDSFSEQLYQVLSDNKLIK